MSDVDLSEFEALNPIGSSCKVAAALEAVGEERGQLEAALAADSRRIANAAILRWLERRGIESVTSPSLTVHRKGTCACGR